MSRSTPARPLLALAVAALAVGLSSGLSPAAPLPAASAATRVAVLRLGFDHGETLRAGSRVVDTSGRGHDGTVRGTAGALVPAPGFQGTVGARYPAPCTGDSCPHALVEVPSSPDLSLDYAPFEWGARVELASGETGSGENLVQKGLYADAAGQWKLQVDGVAGAPSCVVSGSRGDGTSERVVVLGQGTVATGTFHRVTCRRDGQGVALSVDGRQVAFRSMRPVRLTGSAPVTVGAKRVDQPDDDQFHGVLDDVAVTRLG